MLYMRVPGHVVKRCSSRLLCEHRVGQGYIQRVVVLDQRRVFVVQDQVFQGAVKVVGFSKSETCGRLVNHTMFDFSFHNYRAGEGALLGLALSDEEGAIAFASQEILCIRALDVSNVPGALVMMRLIVIVVQQRIEVL